jgi:hypothetical protein
MKHTWIVGLVIIVVLVLLGAWFLGFFGTNFNFGILNQKPTVTITYPSDGATVSTLVMISGTASDPDSHDNVSSVEVRINDGDWITADGTTLWGYEWVTYTLQNGMYSISARSYDGKDYSTVETITVTLRNPAVVDSGAHKWAIFITAANFPEKNETKLGNGGLFLSENIAGFFIEHNQYPTSHVAILFDDGWVRTDNGYGQREKTLQERAHQYAITYGSATKDNVIASLNYLINASNTFDDSEVFIWIFNHGVGNQKKPLFGGKILQSSEIFLWDTTMTEKELGDLLAPLKSSKTTILIDACYAGGFADRTIFNLRTSLLFRSGIPKDGRVVISATSKFRCGYASTTQGPVFSIVWFYGLSSGDADGFRPGLLDRGVPRNLKIFKNGVVSVEEAFYYTRYMLRTDDSLQEFKGMQPQINDEYPHRGLLRSRGGLEL